MERLGVDILDIKRFNLLSKNKKNKFLLNNFTKEELRYCFSFKNCASHLAGTFVAKEAVFKALGSSKILLSLIEIRREKNGKPTVWIKGQQQKNVLVSISHTLEIVTAVAIKL